MYVQSCAPLEDIEDTVQRNIPFPLRVGHPRASVPDCGTNGRKLFISPPDPACLGPGRPRRRPPPRLQGLRKRKSGAGPEEGRKLANVYLVWGWKKDPSTQSQIQGCFSSCERANTQVQRESISEAENCFVSTFSSHFREKKVGP